MSDDALEIAIQNIMAQAIEAYSLGLFRVSQEMIRAASLYLAKRSLFRVSQELIRVHANLCALRSTGCVAEMERQRGLFIPCGSANTSPLKT